MQLLKSSIIAIFVLLIFAFRIQSQDTPNNTAIKQSYGAFPEARFDGLFQKYLSNDIFSPFFSWKGSMGIDIVTYRHTDHIIYFKSEFQTVGAKKTDSKINIVGTSYILEGRYRYQFSQNTHISSGVTHLSSHLTQDLQNIILNQKSKGEVIPQIDASDLNIVFVEGQKKFVSYPFQPEFRLRLQAVGFRFRGGGYRYGRPVYVETEITPWRGREKKIVVATQHELGDTYFNDYTVRLELFSKNDKEGRLQLFIAGSPGTELHVSPNVGWHREGIRTGLKLVFWAH